MTDPRHLELARDAGEQSVGEWIAKADERYAGDVMRALIKGGTKALIGYMICQFGARETYDLLQRAADAVAEMIVQPEKQHV